MAGNKQPNQDTGLENLSVNSNRRSGVKEDGIAAIRPTRAANTIQPRVLKCRISRYPVEQSPGIEDTEGHST